MTRKEGENSLSDLDSEELYDVKPIEDGSPVQVAAIETIGNTFSAFNIAGKPTTSGGEPGALKPVEVRSDDEIPQLPAEESSGWHIEKRCTPGKPIYLALVVCILGLCIGILILGLKVQSLKSTVSEHESKIYELETAKNHLNVKLNAASKELTEKTAEFKFKERLLTIDNDNKDWEIEQLVGSLSAKKISLKVCASSDFIDEDSVFDDSMNEYVKMKRLTPWPKNCDPTKTKYFDLASEGIAGPLPSAWGYLASVQEFNLQNNKIVGLIPKSWARMQGLTKLDLSNNLIEGPLPPLSPHPKLVKKTNGVIKVMTVFGSEPPKTSIKRLKLSNNKLSGELPKNWGMMETLVLLYLNGNGMLTGSFPQEWEGMKELTAVYIGGTGVKLKPNPWSSGDKIYALPPPPEE